MGPPRLAELASTHRADVRLLVFLMIAGPRRVKPTDRRLALAVITVLLDTLIASDQARPLPTAFNSDPALVAVALLGPVANGIDLRRSRPTAAAGAPATPVSGLAS